ncbi:MAG: nucleotidyltransferase family protein [Gemmatimonadota bacterium]|nr:nucleotidyltransferase family protein [Gemmatimonadota bacterium]MDH5198033.1 nucleotidyltransferase family protein [Gemmatimonadota bacterium]
MPPIAAVNERLYRALTEVARGMKLRGQDPGLELAGRFGVRRFIERHLAGGDVPEALAEPPKAGRWLERGARLRKEARAVSRSLTEAGIRHCFFKGIALLGRFYRLDERQLADIDLIIDLDHYNDGLAVIHGLGFSEFGQRDAWVPAARRPGVTMHRADLDEGDDEADVLIDLHWGLESLATVLPDEELILPPAVWAGVEQERGLPVVPDEYHAALVLHHLVRHDMLHIRGLLDFILLWQAIPNQGGQLMADLARTLGVERALRALGRMMVDELLLYPLRGVPLSAQDWRGRAAMRRLRLTPWLAWAARNVTRRASHVTVTRSLLWRRFLLADAPRTGQLMRDLVAPPREYLEWRWPDATTDATAWGKHVTSALRSSFPHRSH